MNYNKRLKLYLILFPKRLCLNDLFIDNIYHGKWSTIFGQFWMKGVQGSKIYFYYSKMISKKFHVDWWKIFFSLAENNLVHKRLIINWKKIIFHHFPMMRRVDCSCCACFQKSYFSIYRKISIDRQGVSTFFRQIISEPLDIEQR